MTANWAISWQHDALGIPDLWTTGVLGKDTCVALLDTGLAAPPGLDRTDFEYLDARGRAIGPGDPSGHGTCCASLIASYLGGALGIAPFARIVSLRVLETGTSVADVQLALEWLLGRPDIDVVSCSFVIPWAPPPIALRLGQLVRALTNSGKVVVAAAGDAAGVESSFPETTPNAITVEAVDEAGALLPGAQQGEWIDVAAPGEDLPVVTADGRLALFGESSGAAAIVSGVAALALSTRDPGDARRRLARGLEGLLKSTAGAMRGSPAAPALLPGTSGHAGIINPATLLQAAQAIP